MTSTAMSAPAAAIAQALAALEIRSPTSHTWMGALVGLPEAIVRLADPDGVRRALVVSACSTLYECFYTPGAPRPARPDGGGRLGVDRPLSHELDGANGGDACLEPGWRIVGEEDDRRVVQRGGLRLWVAVDEVEGGARIGDAVSVRLPAGLPAYSPGFYVARGDRGFSAAAPRVLDRFYLDLRPEGAVPFIREATRRLNDAGLAFAAKVVDDPAGFDRRDSAVLAFERCDRVRGLAGAEEVRSAVAGFVGGSTPAMTLRMAPGLAFAEDPGDGESFGWHRCLLVADAAVTAAQRHITAPGRRLEVVRERFARAGISLDAPHLGPPVDGVADASELLGATVRA